MITKVTTLVFALFISAASFAQMGLPSEGQAKTATTQLKTVPGAEVSTSKEGIGSLISKLTDNISPSSFTDAFAKNKPEFTTKANSASTPSAASGLLQSLAGGLKPSSFTSGWAATKTKWMAAAKSATTQKQVASLLGQLASNINPNNFKGEWAKVRPLWEAGVKKLSSN